MAGISLDYLTSLDPLSGTAISGPELTIINKDGKDYSLRVSELVNLVRHWTYRVGGVYWFMIGVNPNNDYPGQVWRKLPNAANRTLRFSADDDHDIREYAGSDGVSIQTGHLPAHAHSVNIATSATDLGDRLTSAEGSHNHTYPMTGADTNTGGMSANGGGGYENSGSTDAVGAHQHRVTLGAHSHNVSGVTGNTGSGAVLDVTNTYIKLSAWYRVS